MPRKKIIEETIIVQEPMENVEPTLQAYLEESIELENTEIEAELPSSSSRLGIISKTSRLFGWFIQIVYGIYKKVVVRIGIKGICIVLLIIIGWFSAVYFYNRYSSLSNDPQIAAQIKAGEMLAEVSKIIEMPNDEFPSIVTVTDPSLLANDAFFEKSAVGDVLIVYAKSRKVFLYRPDARKIINVGAFVQQPQVPAGAFTGQLR